MAKAEINTNRDMNSLFLGFMVILGSILFTVTVFAVQGFWQMEHNTILQETQIDVPYQVLVDQKVEAETQLTTYRWVERDENLVAIPIDRAIAAIAAPAEAGAKKE